MPTPELHAALGASSAHRWLNCPASVLLTANIPDKGSEYAAEGTLAHAYGELKLRRYFDHLPDKDYKDRLADIKADPLYKPEMDDCSDTYAQHVIETANAYEVRPFVAFEQRVDYSGYAPNGFGTADCIILSQSRMDICDYKHGQGVAVSAEDNPQLKLYALGALDNFKMFYPQIETVSLHIIQPRNGGVSVWSTTVKELREWGETVVKPTAALAAKGEGGQHPGEWCRFCKIKNTCKARANTFITLTDYPAYGQSGAELTPEQVSEALQKGEGVVEWLNDLKEFAASSLLDGLHIPGYKLVEGRRSRKWDDQDKAFADIQANGIDESMLYERVPLTVAQLEKSLGKKTFGQVAAAHVQTSPGKPTLAPESDKRAEYSKAANDDFATIPAKEAD